MKSKVFFTHIAIIAIILIFSLGMYIIESNSNKYEKESITVEKIIYLAKFLNKQYEPMPGEEPLKMPIEVTSWPGEFYDPPDVIEVVAELKNNSDITIKSLELNTKIRYKVGKIIGTEDSIDVEKSKLYSMWLNYMEKIVKVDLILPHSITHVKIGEIFLEKDMQQFSSNNERPWECETIVNISNQKISVTNVLPIEVIYD